MLHHRALLLVPLAAVLASAFVLSEAATGCVFAPQDSCDLTHGYPGCKGGDPPASSTSAGGGGSANTGPTTSSGGGGSKPECTADKDCTTQISVPAGPCQSFGQVTCTADHKCAVTYTPGTPSEQTYGTCYTNECDAMGQMITVIDTTNVYDDGNPCTTDLCTDAGVPEHVQMLGPMTTCQYMGTTTGYCELNADPNNGSLLVCAQCDPSAANCTGGWICLSNKCVRPTCHDNVQNYGESDVDCGGPDCPPCKKGFKCDLASDCWSGVCDGTTHTCDAPTCSDHVKNGAETGIDCGGPECNPCADHNPCLQPSDCISGVCMPGAPGTPDVCQTPTCLDGVKNGDETGVDCGGSMCPPCMP